MAVKSATADLPTCGPNKDGTPRKAPELVAIGNLYRDIGLEQAASGGGQETLVAAGECYGLALALNPQNYEATLGLGVTFLARARLLPEPAPLRRSLLRMAKRSVAEAYMLRQGPHEPLYFLAEIAVHEKDYARAKMFLEPLVKVGANKGPVFTLLGYIAQQSGDDSQAQSMFKIAMDAGWPQMTMLYLSRVVEN